MTAEASPAGARNRFLDGVERLGNLLPDPVFIFIWIIIAVVIISVIGAAAGWTATNPVTGEVLVAKSLLTEENLQRLFVEMPKTYTGFTPLGLALTIMIGAGVAERSGLFSALLRGGLSGVPKVLLTPTVMVLGMMTTHAVDAGYLVYIPLAGVIFAAFGRHPVMGIAVGFAGTGVGLVGNLFPGQYDVLILGITESGARILVPDWTMNPIGNWYFSLAAAFLFTALAWAVTERITAPRLGEWKGGSAQSELAAAALKPEERRGLARAGLAALAVVALFASLTLWPGFTPLYDEAATGSQRLTPFYRSLTAGFFLLFILCGWAFGSAVGTIKSHRDIVAMMTKGLEGMVPYLVLIFFGAHFVAMFGWSNLGPITAIVGAEQLRAMNAPPALLLPMLAAMSSWLDFLIASGSAKWTAMAPVATPMMMLLGISPEMTTAAYRVGDSVTNLISPLNAYFVLVLTFCQRWVADFRLGSLLAVMLPYAVAFFIGGTALTATWVALEIPVGPGAPVAYEVPTAKPAVP